MMTYRRLRQTMEIFRTSNLQWVFFPSCGNFRLCDKFSEWFFRLFFILLVKFFLFWLKLQSFLSYIPWKFTFFYLAFLHFFEQQQKKKSEAWRAWGSWRFSFWPFSCVRLFSSTFLHEINIKRLDIVLFSRFLKLFIFILFLHFFSARWKYSWGRR